MRYLRNILFVLGIMSAGAITLIETGEVAAQKDVVSKGQQSTFAVTAVGLKVERESYAGLCPMSVRFEGVITTNGPGTVTYSFIGPGLNPAPATLEFKEAGIQAVSATANLSQSIDGDAVLRIIAPNFMEQRLRAGSYVVRCQAHLKLVFRGFTVNHQTRDDMLNLDGWADEVINSTHSFTVNRSGQTTVNVIETGARMGDLRRGNQILAGHATSEGGLRTGDSYPDPSSYAGRFPVEVATASATPYIPAVVYDGVVTQGETAAVVFVTLWEWDNDDSPLVGQYRQVVTANVAPAIARLLRPQPNQSIILKHATELGLPRRVFLGTGPLGLGEVNTRPIGMVIDRTSRDVRYVFDPTAIILTYDTAVPAALNNQVFQVPYVDDRSLEGDYSLFFQVVLVP